MEYPICQHCGAVLKSGVTSCIRCTSDPTKVQKTQFCRGYVQFMYDFQNEYEREISGVSIEWKFGYEIAQQHLKGNFSDNTGYCWAFTTRMLDCYEWFYGQKGFEHPEV